MRVLTIDVEAWPLKKPFVIARGSREETQVIRVSVTEGDVTGLGESTPTARYGESIESVIDQIESVKPQLEAGLDRDQLQHVLPAGAARNALDCALWDLQAKQTGMPIWQLLGISPPKIIETVQTISIDEPAAMVKEAARLSHFPILKIKLDSHRVLEKLHGIHLAAPDSKILIDANESWSEEQLRQWLPALEKLPVCLLEQPLKAGQDQGLEDLTSSIPFGADESCHTAADLPRVAKGYQVINIKLDKSGGLTEAMKMTAEAEKRGLKVMTGCMLGTSLAMAPALLIAAHSVLVDLDAPLLLSKDRDPALHYQNHRISGWTSKIWG